MGRPTEGALIALAMKVHIHTCMHSYMHAYIHNYITYITYITLLADAVSTLAT